MTGKHLLDPVLDFIIHAHGEQPFVIACGVFALLGLVFIAWGMRLDLRDMRKAEDAGE